LRSKEIADEFVECSRNYQLFVDKSRLRELGLKLSQIKEYLEAQPFIYASFTEDEIKNAFSP